MSYTLFKYRSSILATVRSSSEGDLISVANPPGLVSAIVTIFINRQIRAAFERQKAVSNIIFQ